MEYWLKIVTEIILIISSNLREKEWKKIDIIFNRENDRSDIMVGNCIEVSKNMEICRLLRAHAVQMNNYSSLIDKHNNFIKQKLIPINLRESTNQKEQGKN